MSTSQISQTGQMILMEGIIAEHFNCPRKLSTAPQDKMRRALAKGVCVAYVQKHRRSYH
jgi:hypothetical protein